MTTVQPLDPVMEVLQAAEHIKIVTLAEQMLQLAVDRPEAMVTLQYQHPNMQPMTLVIPVHAVATSLENYIAKTVADLSAKGIELDNHIAQIHRAIEQLKQQLQPQ